MERILFAVKTDESCAEFKSSLLKNFEVFECLDGVDTLNLLSKETFDLAILDIDLPNVGAKLILDFLNFSEQTVFLPVVIVCKKDSLNSLEKRHFLNCGASEILEKPLESEIALKRIQNVITISKLQRNVREYEEKLETDPMTGLLNKSGFQAKVRKLVKDKIPGAIIMCDMDSLKFINDNYSHQAGDLVLQGFACEIKRIFPENSVISHISGDEFAAFIPSGNKDEISNICKELFNSVEKNVLLPDRSRIVTASIGIAMFPEVASNFDTLVNKADHALLYVKNHGKASYKFYAPRDDREELLKGRQECTNITLEKMLTERSDEDIQTWLKFGEFRIIYITSKRYAEDAINYSLCLVNIVSRDKSKSPDEKKVSLLNERITDFIKDAMFSGIFSWYSINQLLILATKKETIPRGVNRIRNELYAELETLGLEIQLIL